MLAEYSRGESNPHSSIQHILGDQIRSLASASREQKISDIGVKPILERSKRSVQSSHSSDFNIHQKQKNSNASYQNRTDVFSLATKRVSHYTNDAKSSQRESNPTPQSYQDRMQPLTP